MVNTLENKMAETYGEFFNNSCFALKLLSFPRKA